MLYPPSYASATTLRGGLARSPQIDVLSPSDRATYLEVLSSTLERRFLEAGSLPVIGMSALVGDGSGVEQLLPGVVKAFHAWNKRWVGKTPFNFGRAIASLGSYEPDEEIKYAILFSPSLFRVSTGRLNRFVSQLKERGLGAGGSATAMERIKYMTQVSGRSP